MYMIIIAKQEYNNSNMDWKCLIAAIYKIAMEIPPRQKHFQGMSCQQNYRWRCERHYQARQIGFPFGCAITRNVLKSNAYQKWFSSRFSITTFRNKMKWGTALRRNKAMKNYTIPDAR
ncbi:hypothetical protein RJ639_007462 [Escallonia herrerae]|uniref:Uncharacterized protein n=1 Tax=Escallonia herrerae TaxID=1293975 RepID=A0AA89ATY6_9ASTE|nr:hypothetical protein RJ639_007462 [Escallonia herrerae]